MSEPSAADAPSATAFWHSNQARAAIAACAVLAGGLTLGGYLLGDGLKRAKFADRSVTVRGLAEREVLADLATWTVAFSASAGDMAAAQAEVERDSAAIHAFFGELGFPLEDLQPAGVNVSTYTRNGRTTVTIRQRMTLRTTDIERAQKAAKQQFDLVRRGVVLDDGSGVSYTFTQLNEIKPAMIAEATKDARASAEQFAKDSGTGVGSIRRATQGYFSINSRDGEGGGWGAADTPHKKVRVVTTIDFYLS